MSRNRPSKLSRRVRFALSAVMFVLTGPVSSGLILFNPAAASAGSNNGTIKIHEFNTPSGTESNDPKVCKFNIEAYNLDENQLGELNFAVQGGDGPTGVAYNAGTVGPADVTGYFETVYYSLQPGHYKATLSGDDVKKNNFELKSKVFKVECPVVQPIPSNGSTTAEVNCDLGGLQIHLVNESATLVEEWTVNGIEITPDASGNYLYPVSEDQTYDVTVLADGEPAGHYTGTLNCIVITTVNPAPVAEIEISCGQASVTLSNPVPGNQEVTTAVTLTIKTTGQADRTVVLQPGQTVTENYTFLEDTSGGTAQIQVFNGVVPLDPATTVDTDCVAPQGGGSGGGGGTGGNGGGGEVLGDTTTVPVVTSTPSVLAASTVTELPKTGTTNLPALVIALLGSVVAYELSRRKVGQSSL